ncbi:hypothetical protein K438DRAFT_1996914 [Mycena galopus ATCC 62051]|nr:hypothetical protein K438DRAFT_1996914 [Mycena galopus ATCC 62051]
MLSQYAREEHDRHKPGEGGISAPPAARSVSDPLPAGSSSAVYPLPSSFPINTERPLLGTHRGSVDSLTSVTSLPLLGMVRGVPAGNRDFTSFMGSLGGTRLQRGVASSQSPSVIVRTRGMIVEGRMTYLFVVFPASLIPSVYPHNMLTQVSCSPSAGDKSK